MSKTSGGDDRGSADSPREEPVLDQGNEKALDHLAFLHRELKEAKASVGKDLQIDLLVEANERLVLAALVAQEQLPTPIPAELPRLYLQLREANEQLIISALHSQKLQARAEQALARQQNALASVAHEMRNPLTPISMLAGRMAHTPSEKLPEMSALIEGQVQHLSRMIEDLLDVTRARGGKLRLNFTHIDIGRILREACNACLPLMTAKKLTFEVNISQQPIIANGDSIRVSQIFTNILTNSAKYTPSGGSVKLTADVDAGALKVVVSDNGIGISAEALPMIFDPYMQDAQAIGFNSTGLGIGLTVVRELIDAHGGSVTGASEGPGMGSQFTILFPLLDSKVDVC